jgi:peptidoglycan/LPS O-acetylase OafA/YrhL
MSDDLAAPVTADSPEPPLESPDGAVIEPGATATTAAKATRKSRLPALTGLRGVAAMAVVISHILNTTPSLVHPQLGTLQWWVSYTPLNVLWDGDESVLLFFVLSGFVLARPFVDRDGSQSYISYYPRRFLRLYVPLWGGLVFTYLMTLIESRHSIPAATAWTNSHTNFRASTLQDAALPRVGTTFDGPLWSLHWELLFSATLPLYVWLGRSFRRWNAMKVAIILAVLIMGAADAKVSSIQISNAILYAPMFGVGVFMAFYETELVTWLGSFMARSGWYRIGLFVVVVLTGDLTNEISPVKEALPGLLVTAAHGLGVLGAALLILMVVAWKPYCNTLEKKPIDWLGTRSFSLYLIHDGILITIALWLGGHPNPLLLLVTVIPSCLIGITIFYKFVEHPSQKLSNNVGRSVQKWVNRRRAERAVPSMARGT